MNSKSPSKPIIVTGAAGFIGFHLSKRLCADGARVVGFDNINDYYDPALKMARLKELEAFPGFSFVKGDLADRAAVEKLFSDYKPDHIVHLAAQAGVRYSLTNPRAYTASNIDGFMNILEACRHGGIKHLIYASSSSVYGANKKQPFSVHDSVDHPVSLYAATKKANELMAHTYAHLYGLPCTGLRFFTVYGPWGRPDMALYKFTKALYEGATLDVYNNGDMRRDFTYIDDIVEGVARLIPLVPQADASYDKTGEDPGRSHAPWRVYNIGNNRPENLMDMIRMLEEETGLTAKLNLMPLQPGDVPETSADIEDLTRDTGFRPSTPLRQGIRNFVAWYRAYHRIGNGPSAA